MKLVDKKEMENLIGKLDTLDDQHKEFLKNRWLHYLLWWDERSCGSKWKYYTLRSIVIIGGSVIPLLVGLHCKRPKFHVHSSDHGCSQFDDRNRCRA